MIVCVCSVCIQIQSRFSFLSCRTIRNIQFFWLILFEIPCIAHFTLFTLLFSSLRFTKDVCVLVQNAIKQYISSPNEMNEVTKDYGGDGKNVRAKSKNKIIFACQWFTINVKAIQWILEQFWFLFIFLVVDAAEYLSLDVKWIFRFILCVLCETWFCEEWKKNKKRIPILRKLFCLCCRIWCSI